MKFYYRRREIEIKDQIIDLTYLENRVLKIIFDNPSKCVNYKEIGEKLYENLTRDKVSSKESITILACRLRKKGIPIETVRGYGLRIPNTKKEKR